MPDLNMYEMLGALIVAHFICDYPLQGDFLARAKNHTAPIPGVPWYQALVAHASIHGGAVWFITGFWWLGVVEAVSHAAIDRLKCSGVLGFNGDQAAHVVLKGVWVALAVGAPHA